MSLITLDIPEHTERELQRLSASRGKDLGGIIAEMVDDALLTDELAQEIYSQAMTNSIDPGQDRRETEAGIQRGLEDYAAGRVRSFQKSAAELRAKYLRKPDEH